MRRAIAIACFTVGLLTLASVQAGSFHSSPAKLNDKYLAGKSDGLVRNRWTRVQDLQEEKDHPVL